MKTASIHEIKKELAGIEPEKLNEICLRLAKFKKDNKELLTYILFEAHDEEAYVEGAKQTISEQFDSITNLHAYYVKKSARKILRIINRYIKYSGIATTELALRIHFCSLLKDHKIPTNTSPALMKIFLQQRKKIEILLSKMEADLRLDYHADLDKLN